MGWSEERTEHPDNLQLLCVPCHKAKTARETGKTYIPKQTIGPDGFPIDDVK